MFRIIVGIFSLCYIVNACTLPPDFWCDTPSTAIECTGSTKYCDQYRQTRFGKPVEIKLAYESGCSDSRRLIVDRLYPKVLNNSYFSELIDFKSYPYGLAKRETGEKVNCHHGERECQGNRLLTCMKNQYSNDKAVKTEILNCFMNMMKNKALEPESIMLACLNQIRVPLNVMNTIVACSKGQDASRLQRIDEMETRQILSQPKRFVPFISINGRSHIKMQAYQVILPEKLNAWKKSLQKFVPDEKGAGSCELPPDFWCDDVQFTHTCVDVSSCQRYMNNINGQPIHIKVIYSDSAASRNYLLSYIKSNFFVNSSQNRKQTDGKVVVELEPSASAKSPCGESNCNYQAVQHCVYSHVKEMQTRNNMLLCLMESGGDMSESWNKKCHTFKPEYKDIVLQCVTSNAWKEIVAKRAQEQSLLKPEPKMSDPWIVLNGYSLSSVQDFSNILHKMICLWYRGPNHDRDNCFRCEYEMSHCMG